MATLTQSAEDLYGTITKYENSYECNTVLFKVNSEKETDSEIVKVIKEYSKTDLSIIEDTKIDILGLISQATVLCAGVNKGYLVDTYDTTDICVMLFSRSLPDYDLRNPKVVENLCGFMFLDTKRTKKEKSIYINLICTSRGFGSKLLKFAEQISQRLGYNRVTLSSLDSPLGFYLKKGYSLSLTRDTLAPYELGKSTEDLIPSVSALSSFESKTDLTLQPLRGMLYNEKRSNGQHFWIYSQSVGDSPYNKKNWKYIKPGNLLLYKRQVSVANKIFYNFDTRLYESIEAYLDPSEISEKCFNALDENKTKHTIKINKNGGLITILRNIKYVPDGGISMSKNLPSLETDVTVTLRTKSPQRTTNNHLTKLGKKSRLARRSQAKSISRLRLRAINNSLCVGN
jgi:GNAT superfamily N-acetyltransferase